MSQGNIEGQKYALLIGVSECGAGFNPLSSPVNSVQALRDVLVNPDIGGFNSDQVIQLINPGVGKMQAAISDIFSRCSYRDLVLFYFTGHGVTDQEGKFFFTTRETLFQDSKLNKGTAVAGGFVREEMKDCASRRQVVILDCCFSGAFPGGLMAMGPDDVPTIANQTINVDRRLGSEGRAILTASEGDEYALEHSEEPLSVYTRYLIKGLEESAAAASNNQKFICVGDLHTYICDQLTIAAPTMSPQIYTAKGGRDIILAKVAVDNELLFRGLVQRYLQDDGQISLIGQQVLQECKIQWNLSSEQVKRITHEVTQPYRERQANIEKYAALFQAVVDASYPLSDKVREELHDYQQLLNLRDEDVIPIQAQIEEKAQPIQPEPAPPEPAPPHPSNRWGRRQRVMVAFVVGIVLTLLIGFFFFDTNDPIDVQSLLSFGEKSLFETETSGCLDTRNSTYFDPNRFQNNKEHGMKLFEGEPSRAASAFGEALRGCLKSLGRGKKAHSV